VMLTYGTQWRLYELWLDKLGLCKAGELSIAESSDGSQLSKEGSKKKLPGTNSAVKLTNQPKGSTSDKAKVAGGSKPKLDRVVSSSSQNKV